MDKLKQQIQQRLVANIIMDKCAQSEQLIFRDAWCTQERIIRFTTPFFRNLFSVEESEYGKWKTGDCVMYEVSNGADSFVVRCVLNKASVPNTSFAQRDAVIKAANAQKSAAAPDVILKSWDLTRDDGDINKLFDDFDYLIEKQIPYFERELQEKMASEEHDINDVLKEGTAESVTLNKYERNPKARAACLAAHGTACAVCGIDFAKAYGPEFAGKIEVHHIVPLSEIGREYVVDPVNDLVPVCPNCHAALHSKKDGVYTVEELIKMRAKIVSSLPDGTEII